MTTECHWVMAGIACLVTLAAIRRWKEWSYEEFKPAALVLLLVLLRNA